MGAIEGFSFHDRRLGKKNKVTHCWLKILNYLPRTGTQSYHGYVVDNKKKWIETLTKVLQNIFTKNLTRKVIYKFALLFLLALYLPSTVYRQIALYSSNQEWLSFFFKFYYIFPSRFLQAHRVAHGTKMHQTSFVVLYIRLEVVKFTFVHIFHHV